MPRRTNKYIECEDYYKIELYYPHTNRVCDYALISKSDRDNFPDKVVWLYTGYNFEDIFKLDSNDLISKIIRLCDVIVDGRFEISKRDITLQFRGSSNQRIINVKETLKQNQIVLWR